MIALDSTLLAYFDMYKYVRPGYVHNRVTCGAPKNYLAILLNGSARLQCGDREVQLVPGELLYIPQGCVYESEWFANEEDCILYSIGFIFRAQKENARFSLQKVPAADDIRTLFDNVYHNAPTHPYRAAAAFFTLYDRSQELLTPNTESKTVHAIAPALRRMTDHAGAPIPVPHLASLCHMSESAFYAAFRRQTGQTPVEYSNMLRCRKAVHMLTSTDLSVEIIAGLVGCSTPSYLRRLLKKYIGKTPLEIRRDGGCL